MSLCVGGGGDVCACVCGRGCECECGCGCGCVGVKNLGNFVTVNINPFRVRLYYRVDVTNFYRIFRHY